MSRKADKSELEHLRGLLRNLNSENRSLKRQLARATKRPIVEELEEEEDASLDSVPTGNRCPECFKGELTTVSLGVRMLTTCSNCKYRKATK